MPGRNREKRDSPLKWTFYWYGYSYPESQLNPNFEFCQDVTGNRQGINPFYHERTVMSGSLITYSSPSLGLGNAPSGAYTPNIPQTEGEAFVPGDFINRILSQTGPLTPRVFLPLFVYELKDLPMMLKHAGDLLHKIKDPSGLSPVKEAAAANLAYQFGWAPLIQDLGKLLNFSDLTQRQIRTIRGAHRSNGIRRKVDLGTDTKSNRFTLPGWSSYGLYFSIPTFDLVETKTWATVRWRVRNPDLYGREPTYNEALRSALGLNLGHIPIQLWKAIPWTWMVDWFADISNILIANYNMIDYEPFNLCVMRQTTSTRTLERVQLPGNPQNECSAGQSTVIWQRRGIDTSPHPQFGLKLPYLDNFKLSILGSLAILKTSSGSRR